MSDTSDYNSFDLDHFESAVNSAAGRARGLWIGFVVLITYLVITVGAVTHRDLFLQEPVQLPVLNIKLSLIGFFAVAPVFFLINHFFLLLHLIGLRRRIRQYQSAINRAVRTGQILRKNVDRRRLSLDSFVFVQAFGGSREHQAGKTGWLLRLTVWITMMVAPVALLLQIQLFFLPYHLEWVTWVHRVVVLVDVALLWWFWPTLKHGFPKLQLSGPSFSLGPVLYTAATAIVVVSSLLIFTFPGERMDRFGIGGEAPKGLQYWETPEDFVFFPIKQIVTRKLDLAGEFFIDRDLLEKIKKRKPTGENPWQGERTLYVSSTSPGKDRNLIGANFNLADLRWVDLSGARLQDAKLNGTSLQGASLDSARLQYAELFATKLQGASLKGARLHGAKLNEANLQGASLNKARLQDVPLDSARLQGASLNEAELQGASLNLARLQGASLKGAKLQGASLEEANLQGASLFEASLQGASLNKAKFQGASLNKANLQGTEVSGSSFRQAELINTHLWRSHRSADFEDALLVDVDFKPLPGEGYSNLIEAAIDGVESAKTKKEILDQLSRADPTNNGLSEKDLNMPMDWVGHSPSPNELKTGLYKTLFDLGCHGGTEPYIAQNISARLHFTHFRDHVAYPLARIFLDAADAKDAIGVNAETARKACPGAVGISNKTMENLRSLIAMSKPE